MLTLYDYYRSSAAFRVRITLHLKNLPYQKIPIHLINNGGEQHREQYQKINPQELVPALKNGSQVLTQSLAIIEYLNELQPTPPLLPEDIYEKALVRAFAISIAADIHPLNNLRVLNYLKNEFAVSDEQKTAWYQHWIMLGFNALEKQIAQRKKSDFCFGNEPSLADVCLVPQLFNARRFSCDLTPYPNLTRIDANCQQLNPFQLAWPKEETMVT